MFYPNPARDAKVNLTVPALGGSGPIDLTVQLYTLSSRKVGEETFANVTPGTSVMVQLQDKGGIQLANGLYYVVVTTSQGGKFILKLLVLR